MMWGSRWVGGKVFFKKNLGRGQGQNKVPKKKTISGGKKMGRGRGKKSWGKKNRDEG